VSKNRVALTIHAYYIDVFKIILDRIPKAVRFFDIFVTCNASLEPEVKRALNDAGLES
jgi:hypothetical protein